MTEIKTEVRQDYALVYVQEGAEKLWQVDLHKNPFTNIWRVSDVGYMTDELRGVVAEAIVLQDVLNSKRS